MAATLALIAAFMFALAATLQQRGALELGGVGSASSLLKLLGRPMWLVGTLVLFGGYIFQAAALDRGRLSIIQPLLVTTVVFALPLGYFLTSQIVGRREIVGAGVILVGLALFTYFADPSGGRRQRTRERVGRGDRPHRRRLRRDCCSSEAGRTRRRARERPSTAPSRASSSASPRRSPSRPSSTCTRGSTSSCRTGRATRSRSPGCSASSSSRSRSGPGSSRRRSPPCRSRTRSSASRSGRSCSTSAGAGRGGTSSSASSAWSSPWSAPW